MTWKSCILLFFFRDNGKYTDPAMETKDIILHSCLDELISRPLCNYRKSCLSHITHAQYRRRGFMVIVNGCYIKGHKTQLCHHHPTIRRIPAGNVLLASSVLLSKSSSLICLNIINLKKTEKNYFYSQPFTTREHNKKKAKMEPSGTTLFLAEDGQAYSLGFSIKYSIYTASTYDKLSYSCH